MCPLGSLASTEQSLTSTQEEPTSGISFVPIPSDASLDLPAEIKTPFLSTINEAIDQFKKAPTQQDRIEALKAMQAAINHADSIATPDILAKSDSFHQLKSKLFMQIKAAYEENGVMSLSEENNPPVAKILSNMSPAKADKLMQILLSDDLEKLRSLYDSESTPEAKQWVDFLNAHSIKFLGGRNSKNFKVTSVAGNYSVHVLKVDNRINNPRHTELDLRDKLGDVFAPIHAFRQVKAPAADGVALSRTLLVTDFYHVGTVYEYNSNELNSLFSQTKPGSRGHRFFLDRLLTGASAIMSQLSQVFEKIQAANGVFTDAKPENLALDAEGKIRLFDTKSFLLTKNGIYTESQGQKITSTKNFDPKELLNATFNVEKLHSALLGYNIYAYLTNSDYLSHNSSTNLFDFSIFTDDIGRAYKELIIALTKDPASERILLKEAEKQLQALGRASVKLRTDHLNHLICTKICYDESDSMFTLHSELNQLEDSYIRYNDLRQEMERELDIPHMTPAIAEALNTKEKEANKDTHSISDLNKKFLALADKITAYKTLRQEIKALGMGKQDTEMTSYLSTCDEAIFASGNLDVTQIEAKIKEMNAIKAGLQKPENTAIAAIKNHFLENQSWYTINMMVKGEMIESAMAAIPIKERANLLNSTDPTVTSLFSALAWHRVNRFASPISRDGKIMVSSAANAFNTFRKDYQEELQSRQDIVDEDAGKKPKR